MMHAARTSIAEGTKVKNNSQSYNNADAGKLRVVPGVILIFSSSWCTLNMTKRKERGPASGWPGLRLFQLRT